MINLKIRLYDLRKNGKPIIDYQYKEEKSPLNNILLSKCENYLYCSNNLGSILIFDTRKGL